MKQKLIIVDYGMGNLHSIMKKVRQTGVNASISSNPKDILTADKLILPGVGHFGKAMESLKHNNLIETLNEAVLVKKKPVLGICLGAQLMTKYSEEGNVDGLGWIDAQVVQFKIKNKREYKIPHMGWNTITIEKQSNLMKNICMEDEFYFIHSYYLSVNDKSSILNTTNYSETFVSAIEKENIFGFQYHPEKSHDAGATLFKNYINL